MRLLLATDFYVPHIGGAERQFQLLAEQLALRGHAVQLATVQQPGLARHEELGGVSVVRLRGLSTRLPWFSSGQRRYHPPFPDPGIVRELRRLVDRFRPDVLHASGWIAYSCSALAGSYRPPLLVSVRDHGYTCATRTFFRDGHLCEGPQAAKCLACASRSYSLPKAAVAVGAVAGARPLLARRAAGAHYVSQFVQGNSVQLFGGAAVQMVLPDFLPPDRPSAEPPGLPDQPFILFVGALQAHKGLHVLLDAYQRLADPPPPLVLIGTRWPETPASFPAGVTVLSEVPHAQVMAAWRRCLFGVAPSICAETFGDVVIEAMSQGKPMIGAAVGGHTETIAPDETGLLVPPGDVQGLAAAMSFLISDGHTRERLGRAARISARRFQAASVVPRFEALYQRLALGSA